MPRREVLVEMATVAGSGMVDPCSNGTLSIGMSFLNGEVSAFHHKHFRIGFAYTPTLLHWFDLNNGRGRQLQEEVVKCVRNRK